MRSRLFLILLWILCCIPTSGLAYVASDSVSVKFMQSHPELDLDFNSNGERLNEALITAKLRIEGDSALKVRSISVTGGASPEGSVEINRRLSYQRANNIFDWFNSRVEIVDSVVDFNYLGRDWRGLRAYAENDGDLPYQGEVIEIIDNILSSSSNPDYEKIENGGLADLKALHGGAAYRYMYHNIFPLLRSADVKIIYDYPFVAPVLPALYPSLNTGVVAPAASPLFVLIDDYRRPCKPFYMDLKSNLLYDALALPNIGAEFYVGKNWSVGGNWMYGWWDNDRTHHYWRAYGGELYVRRWFGRKAADKPLTGHHVGIYGGVVTYDFEFGGTGYMGGLPGKSLWDRCNYVAGIEYGYSLPIARRLNLDFTLGVGYMGGKYIKYEPKNGFYQWKSTNRLAWFGPTKAEISLVWLIGCDNYNRRKGGLR